MSYKDKTFCPKADKNNPKCIQCDRFFDENEYNEACVKAGFEIPVAWFLEPPCECQRDKITNLETELEELKQEADK